ncbi:hypothetical protein LV161_008841 [Aspergillus fumigatus]|nr:hypothetical protein LV161_008841 [Aspergillus fumigatus]
MGSVKSKKFTPRRGKAYQRRRYAGKARTTRKWDKGSLDKYVQSKVDRAMKRASRGPPRSVSVKLTPCRVNRAMNPPQFAQLQKQEWPAYLFGAKAERKYAILPISELIPRQRSGSGGPDDSLRSFDTVFIKGVSVRMTLVHAEGVRLMLFAFRNGNRRDLVPCTATRPFEVVEDGTEVPRGVNYEVLTKEELYGSLVEGELGSRHLGWHEGPFAVRCLGDGRLDWKSVDGTCFTSRLSKEEGRPVGQIQVRVDEGVNKACGRVCNMSFPTSGLTRTLDTRSSGGLGSSYTAMRFRHLEFFITLKRREKFHSSGTSRSVSERPLELFIGFDGPKPFEMHVNDERKTVCGCVTAMDMEVYYE